MNRTAVLALASCLAISLTVAGGAAQVQAAPAQGGTARAAAAPAAAGFVRLSGSPGVPAVNPATGTLYVPVQCATAFCAGAPGHVVDIISTAKCNARDKADCRVVATASVDPGAVDVVIDKRTDTVYVLDGGNDVSVLNGARCNARVTTGCSPVAHITVGLGDVAGAIDPATHTLYTANLSGSVSVVNIAACNAKNTHGCGDTHRSVTDNAVPDAIGVDVATDTVYAANVGPNNNADTVSVINGAACNASHGTGCAKTPATVTVGLAPYWLDVDQASDTIYVANNGNGFNTGSVSVFSGAHCNGRVTSGCHRAPATVPTGAGASFVAVDPALHTAFALNTGDDTLSAINTRTCDGTARSGCARRPPDEQATLLHGPGYAAFPGGFALDPDNGTAYIVNVGGDTVLSVTGIGRCNATDAAGCRAEAPSVPDQEDLMTADPATHTIYASNANLPQIDVINSTTCHAGHMSGCSPVARIPTPDPSANIGAIDEATHTLYASDVASSGTLMAINIAACNATHTAGCAATPASVQIGAFPNSPVLDPATHTVYVSYGDTANKIAVVNAATCNGTHTGGCGQTLAVVSVGAGTAGLAVSVATDTVYGANSGRNTGFSGDTVSVLNGATCNARNTSGCGHLAATAKVGAGPFGLVADDATHTLYVINNADGDAPGTVSVLNIATCDGTHTAGCHARFPAMVVGGASPRLAALDPVTGLLYVTDFSSAEVTILNAARCNAEVSAGCAAPPREQAVESRPDGVTVAGRTVYVSQLYAPGSMAVFAT